MTTQQLNTQAEPLTRMHTTWRQKYNKMSSCQRKSCPHWGLCHQGNGFVSLAFASPGVGESAECQSSADLRAHWGLRQKGSAGPVVQPQKRLSGCTTYMIFFLWKHRATSNVNATSVMSVMCFIFYQNKNGGDSYEAPWETIHLKGPLRMPDGSTRR